ncbi:MAG: hypothetical protein FWG34_08305 [Oscillospiraceae bacterium]|nr:hypothetical protein [Oscillospiraceae bacterium]
MKKFLASILALALIAAIFTAPVFAGWEIEANNVDEGGGGVAFKIGAYTVKPVLDGKLDGDGAYTKIAYRSTDMSYAWSDDVDNAESWAKGLNPEIYASYDASNIYILVVSNADHYFNECEDGDVNSWQYSCIQVSLADESDEGGDRLEFGLWRKSDDGGQGSVVWAQHPGAKAEFEPKAGANYAVVLDGGKLYYETVIPVNAFLNYDTVGQDDKIGFNIVVGQADSNNVGHVHTQFSSGCTGNGKNAQYFAKITLGLPIEVVQLGEATGIKLQGELIGSETGWGENALAGRAAAFDGDVATYFDPTNANDPEDYCGMKVSEPYKLTEIRIHPRDGQPQRFKGASIWGFNEDVFDPYGSATLIWESDEASVNAEGEEVSFWHVITADQFVVKDAYFTHFAYFNEIDHGDVGEIELYGIPESGLPSEEPPAAAENDEPAPATPAPAPAPETAPPDAPQTGDGIFGIFALMALVSACIFACKKRGRQII